MVELEEKQYQRYVRYRYRLPKGFSRYAGGNDERAANFFAFGSMSPLIIMQVPCRSERKQFFPRLLNICTILYRIYLVTLFIDASDANTPINKYSGSIPI